MMGNNTSIKIVGHGKVKINMRDGTVKPFPDVMHIPSLSKNLISISTIANRGILFSCDKDSCKMTRGSLVIARGKRHGTLYKLLGSTIKRKYESSFVSEKEEGAESNTSML